VSVMRSHASYGSRFLRSLLGCAARYGKRRSMAHRGEKGVGFARPDATSDASSAEDGEGGAEDGDDD